MIKFFRHIRKSLIQENKMGKYFKYAIGEIILVVIGILIALQLNNVNEQHKNTKSGRVALQQIVSEFEKNKNQIDSVYKYNTIVVNTCSFFLKTSHEELKHMTEEDLAPKFIDFIRQWTFDPFNGALRSSISSGAIHHIKNDSLKQLLFSWEDIIIDLKEQEVKAVEHNFSNFKTTASEFISRPSYTKYHLQEIGESDFTSDYPALVTSKKFEWYITARMVYTQDMLDELVLVKQHNEDIINLIKQELKTDHD